MWYRTEYDLQRWEKYTAVNFHIIHSDNNQTRSKYASNKIQAINSTNFSAKANKIATQPKPRDWIDLGSKLKPSRLIFVAHGTTQTWLQLRLYPRGSDTYNWTLQSIFCKKYFSHKCLYRSCMCTRVYPMEYTEKHYACTTSLYIYLIIYLFTFNCLYTLSVYEHIDELVQERRNSIANALELRLSCTNPSTYTSFYIVILSNITVK